MDSTAKPLGGCGRLGLFGQQDSKANTGAHNPIAIQKMIWPLLLLVIMTLAGCTDAPDGSELTPPGNPHPTTDPTSGARPTPASGPGNNSAAGNAPVPPIVNVSAVQAIRVDLSAGAVVHRLRLTATSPFTVDGVSFHSDGTPAGEDHMGIALWPADAAPALDPTCRATEALVWDSTVEEFNVRWEDNPSGTYDLWVWNAAGTWIGVEFDGGEAKEDAPAFTPQPTPWRVNATTAGWARAGNGAAFTETVDLGGPGLFVARATAPGAVALESAANMSVAQGGSYCAEDSADAEALQRPRDLRLAAIVTGKVTWSGESEPAGLLDAGGSGGAAWFVRT